jgi:signal transduction histidine kinase
MQEIVSIRLDNEMDLILAHKRTIKLAELSGLTLSAQTTFATAVSEIARTSIAHGTGAHLSLTIGGSRTVQNILAILRDDTDLKSTSLEAIQYARKLVGDIEFTRDGAIYQVTLKQRIPFPGTLTQAKLEQFKTYFTHEPPLSPYDEIRKKNIQLIELTHKLRESENQYRTLTDTLPLMMFSMNAGGDVTYANKWLSDHLSISAQSNVSIWKNLFHAADYEAFSKGWALAQRNQTIFRSQARLRDKDKASEDFVWHLITILPVVGGFTGFFVDIHAQKLVEETLKDNKELRAVQDRLTRYQLQLEEKITELNVSNHDLEQFAYIASHDLQEPLRKIKTFTALLEGMLSLDEKEKYYFDKIISSSDRMSNLIQDVLNYSRLSQKEENFSTIDLNGLLADIQSDFELTIAEKQVDVQIGLLPTVKGIRYQLVQLFSNLLSNALKFSAGALIVRVSSRIVSAETLPFIRSAYAKSYHEIEFKDNGIGFETQYAEQIFTIFQRLNDSQTYSGTGIGLAVCKKIVNNHEGYIVAEGELGKGATFRIYFPVA